MNDLTEQLTVRQRRNLAIDAAVRQFVDEFASEAPWLTQNGVVAGIVAAVVGVLDAEPSCDTCGEPHPTYEHEWVFTFASHHHHPVTNEPLVWCYTTVRGTPASSREQMRRVFGDQAARGAGGFSRCYESREAAGVVRYGLTEVTPTGRAVTDGAS